MDSKTLSLSRILTNEVRYTVPLFQRKYVWNEQDNWWPLWTDVVETTSRLMTDRERGVDATRPHFLGTVVHEGLLSKTGQMPEQRIIDGQQRMTTLQLLLAATRVAAIDCGLSKHASKIGRLIENPHDSVKEVHDRHKVWPTNADRESFQRAMNDDPDHSLLGSAYRFFRERVIGFVNTADGGSGWDPGDEDDWAGPSISAEAEAASAEDRLAALIDTLRDLIRIVVIELDPAEDDAQVIFETLNAHGTALLPSDLVKNHMFNRAQVAGLSVDALHGKYWAALEDEWYSQEDSVGRTRRQRLDLAIGFWAASASPRGADVAQAHLFSTVQEIARARSGPMSRPDPEGVNRLFAEIAHHVTTWRRLRSAPYGTAEGRFMSRLHDLNTTTPMPLVLWMAAQVDGQVPRAEFERALVSVESYLVRRAACGLTAKNYNRVFAGVLARAKKADPAAVGEAVTNSLADLTDDSSRWPEDWEFESALTDEPQYRRLLRASRVRMVLEALESAMLGPDVEQLAPPGASVSEDEAPDGGGRTRKGKAFTVEHVLPRAWETNWPLPPGLSDPDRARETQRRNDDLERLGNLTLVTGAKNSQMSNSAWQTKRNYLQTKSLLMLTQSTILARPLRPGEVRTHDAKAQAADEFFADLWATEPCMAITVRGACLAQWALKVWPRP
ncbi:DUF262 domain-containing protein [Micromonospora sp. IBSANI012]|uniref:DUF262 domain-containing protein n=1 Tax=Micromonospora sp. IBSANI012 TaxID=3457761 RepID=UPI0040581678